MVDRYATLDTFKLVTRCSPSLAILNNVNVSRVAYLSTILSKVNFTENSFQTIPGEVIAGEKYAEYHVDDEELYQMILDTFYVKQ